LGGREQLRPHLVPSNLVVPTDIAIPVATPAPNADFKTLRGETERALEEIGGRRLALVDELRFAKGHAGLDSARARALVATIARGALGVERVHAKLDPRSVAALLDRKPSPGAEVSQPLEDPATRKWR
jgi:hypothetical protein